MSQDDRNRLPRVELEIQRGRANNKIRRIDVPVFLIGSAHDCDLVLADRAIPEAHTYLYITSRGVSVRRIGEGPQLAIDGREVEQAAIHNGQTLQIGRYEFTLRIDWNDPTDEDSGNGIRPCVLPGNRLLKDHEPTPAIAMVRSLLEDIRSALRVETNLQLYTAALPWRAITAAEPLLVRKASA